MERINLFRVGQVWHYRFQVGLKRRQRSTGERLKGKAMAIAEQDYRRARMWVRGAEPIPTLDATIGQWLRVHAPTASPAHLKSVRILRRLHLYGLGDLLLDELTTERVESAMLEHLRDHAAASVNQWLRILRLVCRWAIRRGLIPVMPWSIKLFKVQKRPRSTLPVQVAMQWLARVDALSNGRPGVSTAIRLMFGIGLRESETITARWEWIDWARRCYTPGITKGREAQAIPMPQWLIDHLYPLRKTVGLIAKHPSGKPFTPGFTRRVMRAANASCGIDGVTPHRLRGTFATLLSEAGVPIQTIQRVMRHKSHVTTMAYLEERMELAVSAQESIAQSAGFPRDVSKISGEKVANTVEQTREE